jgi:hypothetical protein
MRQWILYGVLLILPGCSTYDRPTYSATGPTALYNECLGMFTRYPAYSDMENDRRYLEWKQVCINQARGLAADNQAVLNQMGMALILQNQYQQMLRQGPQPRF